MNHNDIELGEEIHSLTKDELIELVKKHIQHNGYLLVEWWDEKKLLKQDIKMLQDALVHGTAAVEDATKKMCEYDALIKRSTKTILMWRTNCYLLIAVLVIVAIVLMTK